MNAQPEGLVLGIKKIPSGIQEIKIAIAGIRRKCIGSKTVNAVITRMTKIEFIIRMEIVAAAMSSLANQLMDQ
jgi:hypothetical protein